LNCGNVEDYTVFHGCKKREDNFKKVLRNIEKIAELKKSLGIDILFGVSLLIDERNINGLTQAIDILINIQKNNPYAIDNILVRPVMKFEHFEKNYAVKNSDTNKNIIEKLVNSANYYEKCKDVDIKLITRGDWYEPRPSLNEYGGDKCLSYGWFSQIMYNGNIQLCSESFCDPKFTIGNIFENSINDIWQSERRKELIDKINKEKCFVGKCQHNSRGHQLNRIFNQIEKMRKDGKMAIVKKWIKDLRKMTVPPYHSFFM
jgi:radical SAM protein with 4Fe4S-binding SPASM domain